MKLTNVKFELVRMEMARKFLTIQEMADGLGCSRDTLSRKLSGKAILDLDEAFELNQKYFPEHTVEELFKELRVDVA